MTHSTTALAVRLDAIRTELQGLPFHQACELVLNNTDAGKATITFAVNDFTSNPHGALHGGILYAMMDVACFWAVIPQIGINQHPVSVEVNTSLVRAAYSDETVEIKSWVDRIGNSLAAMRCEAYAVDQKSHKRLIATGSVTKSILTDRKK